MQFGKATSWLVLSLCALSLWAAACDPEDKPGTAIVLLVRSDIEELSSIQVKALGSEDSKDEEADDHTEQTSFDGVDEATPVVVKPGKSDEVLIVVSGFDGTRSKNPLAEVSFRATFVEGRTVKVPVFLGNVCVGEFCKVSQTCSGGPLQEARECASIRALKKGEFTEVDPHDDAVWDFDADPLVRPCMDGGVWIDGTCIMCSHGRKPLPDGSCGKECDGALSLADGGCPLPTPECDGGTKTDDGRCVYCADGGKALADGMCPPAPTPECDGGTLVSGAGCVRCADGGSPLTDGGCPVTCKSATCDVFPQCGCKSGEKCQDLINSSNGSVSTACVPDGTVSREGACKESRECVAGTTCVDGVCRPYCNTKVDCSGDAPCVSILTGDDGGVDVEDIKVCVTPCTPGVLGACATGTSCTNYTDTDLQFCVLPQSPCPFEEDGRCDDQTGARYCAAGTDKLDCAPQNCATTPPNPPGVRCDLVSQCGCERTQGCYATYYLGGASEVSCWTLPSPQPRQGAACDISRINSCGKGYDCIGGQCKRFCRVGADCPSGTTCDGIVIPNPDAGVGVDAGTSVVRGIKVCW